MQWVVGRFGGHKVGFTAPQLIWQDTFCNQARVSQTRAHLCWEHVLKHAYFEGGLSTSDRIVGAGRQKRWRVLASKSGHWQLNVITAVDAAGAMPRT
eukprot:scaffold129365_cov17-Tisochrysis_lutea.AAC.1